MFVSSWHNWDWTKNACDYVLRSEPDARQVVRSAQKLGWPVDDISKDVIAAADECRSVRDYRELGRRMESELLNALAVNPLCAGLTVIREPHTVLEKG